VTAQPLRPQDVADLIPAGFTDSVGRFTAEQGAVGGPSGAQWAAALPKLLAEVLDDWGLQPTGPGRTGWSALVVPVERDSQPVVLKLAWPHIEARDEPLALRHWGGRGAVRLVAADPARGALLLEPLDAARDLTSLDPDAACEVVGTLLGQLHVPAPPGLRPVSEYVRTVLSRLDPAGGVLPRRMVERSHSLLGELTSEPGCDATLLHTDLHYANVLASLPGSARPDWLAVDPHAMAGHPGFEIQPLLRNRTQELGTGSTFRWQVRRRLEIACESAAIDEDAALAWTYLHTAMQAVWASEDGDADGVSFDVALLKALDG
jgi:streptomycin 6-kinase